MGWSQCTSVCRRDPLWLLGICGLRVGGLPPNQLAGQRFEEQDSHHPAQRPLSERSRFSGTGRHHVSLLLAIRGVPRSNLVHLCTYSLNGEHRYDNPPPIRWRVTTITKAIYSSTLCAGSLSPAVGIIGLMGTTTQFKSFATTGLSHFYRKFRIFAQTG